MVYYSDMENKDKPRHLASFGLSTEARRLLKEMSQEDGLSMTAWLEVLIRATKKERIAAK